MKIERCAMPCNIFSEKVCSECRKCQACIDKGVDWVNPPEEYPDCWECAFRNGDDCTAD